MNDDTVELYRTDELAALMRERAAANGPDAAREPFLRGEAGGRHILALAVVVLGLIIATPVAYSVMTPTSTTALNATPAVNPSTTPLPVAPPPSPEPSAPAMSPAPTATSTPGPAGPQGPAGTTTVIYVPVARASTSVSASTPKPKPKPTVDPYAKYAHGSACGSYTQYSYNHHDGRTYKFAWSYFGSPGHWTFEQVPASCPEWSQHTPPNK